MIPEFFVIGAQKAGSTYLLECLNEHPRIFMPPYEVRFFEDPEYDSSRMQDFEQHFEGAKANQVIGVKRPNILGRPECPARLAEHMPHGKLIVILREPIQRALSAYFHYMKTGLLPVKPLDQGMRAVIDGTVPGYPRASEVLTFGLYAESLARFDKYYPSGQIYITLLDEIRNNPAAELEQLYRFLGVDSEYQPRAIGGRPMASPYSLTRLRLWNAIDGACRRWNADRTNFVRRSGPFWTPLVKLNQALDKQVWERLFTAKRPSPQQSLQSELADFYRQDLQALEQRLGSLPDSWKSGASV